MAIFPNGAGPDKRPNADVSAFLDAERDRQQHSNALPGDHEGDFVTENEQRDLARGLHQRHISLIALAGAIVR